MYLFFLGFFNLFIFIFIFKIGSVICVYHFKTDIIYITYILILNSLKSFIYNYQVRKFTSHQLLCHSKKQLSNNWSTENN